MFGMIARCLMVLGLIASGVSLVFAHLNGPLPGYTGAPGEGTCADAGCHDVGPSFSAGVSSGPVGPRENDTLAFHVSLNGGGGVVDDWGFQVTISDSLNQPSGQIIVTDTVRTQLQAGMGGREYLAHTAAGSHYEECSCTDYQFKWVRPSGTPQPEWITINISGVFADGDGTSAGDFVLTDTVRARLCTIDIAGDVNLNRTVSSSDVIYMVGYTFKGGPEPGPCTASGDVNCSGDVTSADIIHLVNYVFKSGIPPCDICPLLYDGTWGCSF